MTFSNTPAIKENSSTNSQYFEDKMFCKPDHQPNQSILAEISQYLGDEPDSRQTSPLTFWQSRQDIYPGLAKMAMHLLAIPATSYPSEGVFNKTKRILGPQRANLASLNVEVLLCVKYWYSLFGPLYQTEAKPEPHVIAEDLSLVIFL